MCLLFVYLNDDPGQSDYKLVVASNRDEYWVRPTEQAKVRGDNPKWVSGVDLAKGREGGTWLGLSTSGRFAALLNILACYSPNKRPRGRLVGDFICGSQSCEDYLDSLSVDKFNIYPFKLVCIDLSDSFPSVHLLENSSQSASSLAFPPGIYSFDNTSERESLWQKTIKGEEKFSNIVREHGRIEYEKVLTDCLIDLLNDKTQYFPDKQLQKQYAAVENKTEGELIRQISARFVFSPLIKFGTRTNTVILVDFNGNCEYVERSLETPVDVDKPKWSTLKHQLQLNVNPTSWIHSLMSGPVRDC